MKARYNNYILCKLYTILLKKTKKNDVCTIFYLTEFWLYWLQLNQMDLEKPKYYIIFSNPKTKNYLKCS